jgi:LAO/AO transport system kinase
MSQTFKRKRHPIDEYVQGILSGDRVMLGKAITLIESHLPADIEQAEAVIESILPHTGASFRIGITGVPGAGKSTFIEAFGKYLTSVGKRIAVLTIDPSSQKTGGSILGDKTRMEDLANDPNAFVRPSASGTTLGGVHFRTRETMLLCEAAGFEIVIIETVGVGQSETSVKGIVDFFLLLLIAGAGDELQGIKRGIMEMADAVAINKADGDNIKRSKMTQKEYQNALHTFSANQSGWYPKVLTCSAVNNTGIKEIWELVEEYEKMMKVKGYFKTNRQQQNLQWMYDSIGYYLRNKFYNHPEVKKNLVTLEEQVETEKVPAIVAAKKLFDLFTTGRPLE